MRIRILILVVALVLTAASCDFDWLMFRFGPAHTGLTPDTSISKDAVASGSVVLNWTGTTGTSGSPAVAKGVAYVSSRELYAFDAAGNTNCSGNPKSCTPLWTASPGGPYDDFGDPAVVGGVVYVSAVDPGGGGGDALYAFDAAGTANCSGSPKTCAPLWTGPTGGDVFSPPTVDGGIAYVASDDGKLYAFDASGTTNCSGSPKTCAPLWTAGPLGNQNHTSPAVANGMVYVATGDVTVTGEEGSGVAAFDAAGTTNCSGTPKACTPLWQGRVGNNFVISSPAVAGGVVYIGSGDRKLVAFDAVGNTDCSGTIKICTPMWTTATGGGVSSPAVANGVVYSGDDKLYAFDAAGTTNCSGSPKICAPFWTGTTGGGISSSPAVANGIVYIGSDDHKLYTFDAAGSTNCSGSPKTCSALWTGTTGAAVSSSPAVSHGAVYVGSDKLYAFGLEKVPPTTSILIPANGATLSGTAILDASASDNVKVTRVEFRVTGGSYNDALIGSAAPTAYGWIAEWDTTSVPNGPYTLNSVAFDAAGNSSRSANVNITVDYPPPSAKAYLTFDDGPSVYTPQILSELDSGGARASFFVTGQHATQYPSHVQQENAKGEVVADHTWDHPDLTTLPPEQVRQELESTADEIENLTAKRPTLWRAPYSLWNATVNDIASSLGLTRVGADVNGRDYLLPGTDAIISAVLDNVHDGSIVQLHDGSPDGTADRSQTVAALPTIIDTLRKRGYQLASLDAATSAAATAHETTTAE